MFRDRKPKERKRERERQRERQREGDREIRNLETESFPDDHFLLQDWRHHLA